MAQPDRIGVDDAPGGLPRVLEEQRTRLAQALTPEAPRPRSDPPPDNAILGFAQRIFGGQADPSGYVPFTDRLAQGAGDVLGGAARGAIESPIGQAGLAGLQGIQNIAFDIPAGLFGIGLQKGAEAAGGGRGREEEAVTRAVTAETDQMPAFLRPFATPILYASAAGEAKRVAQRQANLPAFETEIAGVPIRLDVLDISESILPIGGVAGAVSKFRKAGQAAQQAAKGVIRTEFETLVKRGTNETEAATALIDKFGAVKAQQFFETGADIARVEKAGTIAGTAPIPAGERAARGALVFERGERAPVGGLRERLGKTADAFADVGPKQQAAVAAQARMVAERSREAGVAFEVTQGAASRDLARSALRLTNEQTARMEQNIASTIGDGATAAVRTQDEVFREIGSNLTKLEVDDPVKELILANAARNYDEIAKMSFADQRRGVVTIAEQMREAQRMIPDIDLAEMLRTPRGTAFNAETLLATQQAIISKGTDVLKTAERLAENATDADKARLILELTEFNSLQRVLAGGRSEAGRALRALREVVDNPTLKPRAVFDRAAEFLGGKENSEKLVGALVDIWTTPGIVPEVRDQAIFALLRSLDKPGMWDFIFELRRNSILSGPITLEVNLIGNTSMLLAERALTRTAQASWEAVLAAIGKRPGGREVFFSEILPGIMGMTRGAQRGFKDAKSVLRAELSGAQVSKFVETGQFYGRQEATAAVLGGGKGAQVVSAVVNSPTRALAATDAVFYAMAHDGELYAQAIRQAAKEGLRGRAFEARAAQLVENPTREIMTAAVEHAKLVTLKGDPSSVAKAVLSLRRSDNVAVKSFAHLIAPFVQAPDNLVKLAGSYSPLGFIDAAFGSGKGSAAARSAALARASVGSVGMYTFVLSKLQDGTMQITGGVPRDVNERNTFYAEGKIPYAVKIGEGPWIQFSRIEPFGTPIKWMAAVKDTWDRSDQTISPGLAAQMVGVGVRAMLDATYMSGFSDFATMLENPSEDAVQQWLARSASGFIPFSSLLRTTAYATDPYYRDPEDEIERIQAQLPGLQENVRPRLEVTGEPAMRPESRQGIAGMINPILISPERQDVVLATLGTLSTPDSIGPGGEKIPGTKLLLTFPADEIRGLGLTKSESFRLDQVAQTMAMGKLGELFQSAEFNGAQDWRKRELAEKVISDTRTTARGLVADEILSESKDPAMVARASVMKVGTIQGDLTHTRVGNISKFVDDLRKRGLLSSEVKTSLDRTRRAAESLSGKPDPTVDEMLSAAPLVSQYLANPPYGTKARPYGNAQEWSAVAEARKKMTAYIRENPAPPGIAQWIWYSRVDKEGAALIRRYEIVGASPERSRLLKAHPEIERYLTSTKAVED